MFYKQKRIFRRNGKLIFLNTQLERKIHLLIFDYKSKELKLDC